MGEGQSKGFLCVMIGFIEESYLVRLCFNCKQNIPYLIPANIVKLIIEQLLATKMHVLIRKDKIFKIKQLIQLFYVNMRKQSILLV